MLRLFISLLRNFISVQWRETAVFLSVIQHSLAALELMIVCTARLSQFHIVSLKKQTNLALSVTCVCTKVMIFISNNPMCAQWSGEVWWKAFRASWPDRLLVVRRSRFSALRQCYVVDLSCLTFVFPLISEQIRFTSFKKFIVWSRVEVPEGHVMRTHLSYKSLRNAVNTRPTIEKKYNEDIQQTHSSKSHFIWVI